MTRDLSEKQYQAAMHRHGFTREGFLGYWRLPIPGLLCVSDYNAGDRRRDKLAYMLRELDRFNTQRPSCPPIEFQPKRKERP